MGRFLIAVLCAVLSLLAGAEARSANVSSPQDTLEMTVPSQVIVYYFHGNARCVSCRKLEQYAKEAVEKYFSEQLGSGRMLFREINIDRPENRHFVQDYQLFTKSVVVSLREGGEEVRYKNLDKVWTLLRDQNAYHDYIRNEIMPFLKGE
jgi:thiol-disulfide isomerase/thioredoxin